MPSPDPDPRPSPGAPPAPAGDASTLAGVRVLRIGHFDPDYSRNRIVTKALRRAGAEVLDAPFPGSFARRAARIARRVRAVRPDVLLVPYPAHGDLPVVRAARRGPTPVLFDPLVSLSDTMVGDRALVGARSWRGRRYRLEDRIACRLADRIMVDTDAHAAWFAATFGIPADRLVRVWVGADDELVRPRPPPVRDDGVLRVFAYGTYLPLQGIDRIVEAAAILEGEGAAVTFEIVGDGQTAPAVRARATALGVTSVRFHAPVPFPALVERMAAADVCLGIFGTTDKARRVVPNKVFDALAAQRAVVTADTPAAREALVDGVHARLIPPGDAPALAAALRALHADPAARARLATAGHERFVAEFSIDAIARTMHGVVADLLGGRASPAVR